MPTPDPDVMSDAHPEAEDDSASYVWVTEPAPVVRQSYGAVKRQRKIDCGIDDAL
jgi:hypothetical protein